MSLLLTAQEVRTGLLRDIDGRGYPGTVPKERHRRKIRGTFVDRILGDGEDVHCYVEVGAPEIVAPRVPCLPGGVIVFPKRSSLCGARQMGSRYPTNHVNRRREEVLMRL